MPRCRVCGGLNLARKHSSVISSNELLLRYENKDRLLVKSGRGKNNFAALGSQNDDLAAYMSEFNLPFDGEHTTGTTIHLQPA